jgi:hypothetical protein
MIAPGAHQLGSIHSLQVAPFVPFSLGIAGKVLTFRTKAWSTFARPHAGCRSVGIRTSTELIPGEGLPRLRAMGKYIQLARDVMGGINRDIRTRN